MEQRLKCAIQDVDVSVCSSTSAAGLYDTSYINICADMIIIPSFRFASMCAHAHILSPGYDIM